MYLAPSDIGLGKRESIADAAKVMSRMGDIIMARVFAHESVKEIAAHSSVPVINALSDVEHPCQALADVMTMWEHKKRLDGLRVAFIGDCENNVTHSLALMCATLGMHFKAAGPNGYKMNRDVAKKCSALAGESGASVEETSDPKKAVENADVVYTDTWVSMGDEAGRATRLKVFRPYRVTSALMNNANKDALFMHDLPAYRENEVEPGVIDGRQSVVWDQAENRLHVQKALMVWLAKQAS